MSTRELFIRAVQTATVIPEDVRAHAHEVGELDETVLTQSYLDFLERESSHNPRGPKWGEIMRQRRLHMSPYVEARVAQAFIRFDGCSYYVMISTDTGELIYHEDFRYEPAA